MKHKPESVDSVHLAHLPKTDPAIDFRTEELKWKRIMELRDEVLRVLEGLRKDQVINSNQEASVEIILNDPDLFGLIDNLTSQSFAALCIVSEISIRKGDAFAIKAVKSPHPKCQRCWNFWPSVGADPARPDICQRCADVVASRK
jgi:isoleucyl-tRNA synthetase